MRMVTTTHRRYKLNRVGADGLTATVAIPPSVLKHAVSMAHLEMDEFIKKFNLVAYFPTPYGVYYSFEEKEEEK
jgi:hypothetical protein